MARKPRIFLKNGVYHVVLTAASLGKPRRGRRPLSDTGRENRLKLFRGEADRKAFEALVAEGTERFGHQVLAFCCMSHQINLVIRTADTPLSVIMQNISFRYTRHYNSRHDHTGSIFSGRYQAVLVDARKHLNELVRYVHNQPVQHKYAKSAAAFKNSSHQAYIGKVDLPWLDTDTVLSSFGKSARVQQRGFEKYVNDGLKSEPTVDFSGGTGGVKIVGDASFRKKAMKPPQKPKKRVTLNQVARQVCKEEGVTEVSLKGPSRARHESAIRQMIACIAIDLNAATLTEVAERFNRDLTTMSRNQRYFRENTIEDADIKRKVNRHKRALLR